MSDLPYVPPLKSAHSCRLCGRWLEGEWSGASLEEKSEIQRQMDVGRCDDCTRKEAAKLVEINPNQHCTSEECPFTFSHTAQWCGYEQTRQCDCHWDYPERGQL